MAILLDTSVLIGGPVDLEEAAAISVISLAELHFGVLVAPDDAARAIRVRRLALVESQFDPIPFDVECARECGRLNAVVAQRGAQPRRRAFDLAIAATASVQRVPLLTRDAGDFRVIGDLVDVRSTVS